LFPQEEISRLQALEVAAAAKEAARDAAMAQAAVAAIAADAFSAQELREWTEQAIGYGLTPARDVNQVISSAAHIR